MKTLHLKYSVIALALTQALSSMGAYAQQSNEQSSQNDLSEDVEVIQVSGIKSSLSRALGLKQDSANIQDSISAEDIGKFPDQNVAESLQRITGVSISRVNGEGSEVTVRSFGPEFNAVKLNNRTLASVTGGRSFDFQVLPSELIGGADVIKSPMAEMAEGSIGAYINVRTARPLDSPGLHMVGSLNGKYQSLAEKVKPEMSAVVSNTFWDDSVGVLFGLAYKDAESRIDTYKTNNWSQYAGTGYGFPIDADQVLGENGQPTTLEGSRGPGRTIFNMTNENRKRVGGNVVLQWQPNEYFEGTFDALYTKLDREFLGSGLQIPNQTSSRYSRAVVGDDGTLLEATINNTDVEMNINYGDEQDTTIALGFNGIYTKDAFTLSLDLSHSKAKSSFSGDDSTALHYSRFDADGIAQPSAISLDYSSDIPDVVISGGIDVTDPSKVRAAWQRFAGTDSQDEVDELKLDALYVIDTGNVESIKMGVAYSSREIEFNTYGTEFDPVSGGETWGNAGMYIGDGSTWGNDSAVGLLPNSVYGLSDNDFMNGLGGNFPRQWAQISSWQSYRDATQAYLEQSGGLAEGVQWDSVYRSPGASYINKETSLATYIQLNLAGEISDFLWTGNVGGRYVTFDNTAKGTASTIDLLYLNEATSQLPDSVDNTASTSAKDSTVDTNESYFLPSANFKLNLDDGYLVRAAMAKTITRPSLGDSGVNVQETAGVDAPTVTLTGGNPYLKSYQVKQLDLSFEYYANNGNAYSIGYFYKDISNFISTITTVGLWDGPVDPVLEAAYANNDLQVTYNSTRKENRTGGKIQGLELGGLYYFDYLPDFWSGLGVQANYTYAHSVDKDASPVNLPAVIEPGSVLEGFAKNSFNVVAFYDKDGLQARLAYNWRDTFMDSRSGDGTQPEYTDAYGQLDMSVSYDVTDNITLSFDGINLTDETRLQYFGQRNRVSLVEMTGTRYQLGLRVAL